ncbi:MAG: hypothetical protein U0457_06500 [Candidatus Sericytochromatia bacterium]
MEIPGIPGGRNPFAGFEAISAPYALPEKAIPLPEEKVAKKPQQKETTDQTPSQAPKTPVFNKTAQSFSNVLKEIGLPNTPENNQLASVLANYGQPVNKQTMNQVAKLLAGMQQNGVASIEAGIVILMNNLKVNPKAISAVRQLLTGGGMSQNLLILNKDLKKMVDKLNDNDFTKELTRKIELKQESDKNIKIDKPENNIEDNNNQVQKTRKQDEPIQEVRKIIKNEKDEEDVREENKDNTNYLKKYDLDDPKQNKQTFISSIENKENENKANKFLIDEHKDTNSFSKNESESETNEFIDNSDKNVSNKFNDENKPINLKNSNNLVDKELANNSNLVENELNIKPQLAPETVVKNLTNNVQKLSNIVNNLLTIDVLKNPNNFPQQIAMIKKYFADLEITSEELRDILEHNFPEMKVKQKYDEEENSFIDMLQNLFFSNEEEKVKKTNLKAKLASNVTEENIMDELKEATENISDELFARELLSKTEDCLCIPLPININGQVFNTEIMIKREDQANKKTEIGEVPLKINLAVNTKNLGKIGIDLSNLKRDLQIHLTVNNKFVKDKFDKKLRDLEIKLKKLPFYVQPISCKVDNSNTEKNSLLLPKKYKAMSMNRIDGVV